MIHSYMLWCWIDIRERECFNATVASDQITHISPARLCFSILGVCAIYLVMNIGIMGVIPWREAINSTNIGTDAVEAVWGHVGGVIITVLIVTTAFASVYAGLLGASRLPYNAARDHLFFSPFGRLHPRLRFPHVSLLVMGVVTAIASLFSLESILNALIAVSIVVQFIGGPERSSFFVAGNPNSGVRTTSGSTPCRASSRW